METRHRPISTTIGAAALLPASLLGAALVAAPFAGTTTSPLAADSRPTAATAAQHAPAAQTHDATSAATATTPADLTSASEPPPTLKFSIPTDSVETLGMAYGGIVAVGLGVVLTVAVRRNRTPRDER